jgi:paraquat-inducible protein B
VGKKTSKTAIGAFVVGAIVLTVMSVIVFGSGKLFSETVPVVFYFEGSVQGLSVGSPVKCRGVQIGEVKDIKMTLDNELMEVAIPVHAVLYPDRINFVKGRARDSLKPAIEAGLRAQLQMQSLITGQLLIALDFYPDAPAPQFKGDGTVPEIPTIPTVVEQLENVVKNIKFDEILEKLTRTADGIEKLINDPDIEEGIDNFNETLEDIQLLVRNVNRQVDPLSTSVISTADEYGKLARNFNEELDSMSAALEKTLAAAQASAEQLEQVMTNSANITSDGSPVMHELLEALNELKEASRSMGALAEYLERHPESIIFGKGGSR